MPFEIYWLTEAHMKDSPQRKKDEENAQAYKLLKEARQREADAKERAA